MNYNNIIALTLRHQSLVFCEEGWRRIPHEAVCQELNPFRLFPKLSPLLFPVWGHSSPYHSPPWFEGHRSPLLENKNKSKQMIVLPNKNIFSNYKS